MNDHEIGTFLALAKSFGLAKIKVGDFEAIFFPPEPKPQDIDPKLFRDPLQTAAAEDEVKFWHVGGAGIQDAKGNEVAPPLVGEQDGD